VLHDVDTEAVAERKAWMALLARASEDALETGLAALPVPAFKWLRRPETGLYMVRGRVGGTGNAFNLGEMTVTRCTLRLDNGCSGVAYVHGRSHRHAELAALADAMMQSGETAPAVRAGLLEPIGRQIDQARQEMARKAQSTRVEFFTVAREAGNGAGTDDQSDEADAG